MSSISRDIDDFNIPKTPGGPEAFISAISGEPGQRAESMWKHGRHLDLSATGVICDANGYKNGDILRHDAHGNIIR